MKLWKHQREAIDLMKRSGESGYALFMEAGTGKTACVINYLMETSMDLSEFPKVLIFAPLVVCENWRKEFVKIAGDRMDRDILVLIGTGAWKKKVLLKPKQIIVTNYETLNQKEVCELLLKWKPEVLVCDESHRLKSPQAKRSKEILKFSNVAIKRFLLTGTPVLKDELDLFHQFKVMDGKRGETFGDKNFFSFRARYFDDLNRPKGLPFPNWQIKDRSREEINGIISRRAFSVLKKDCLDLPPLVKKIIQVKMSPEQSRAYQSMYKNFVAVIEDSKGLSSIAIAELAITKGLRLQQIASGFVTDENGKAIHFTKNPRLDALREILEDLGTKVIVWACFKENYKMVAGVCEKLGKSYALLTGEQSQKEKMQGIEDFTNGDVQVMIANQGAGGIGINLVEAPVSIYYSRDFSLEKDIQSEARNYRGGSEMHKKVTRVDLVCADTIDQQVVEALYSKKQVLDFVMENNGGKK